MFMDIDIYIATHYIRMIYIAMYMYMLTLDTYTWIDIDRHRYYVPLPTADQPARVAIAHSQ